jgi:hypothetical protein
MAGVEVARDGATLQRGPWQYGSVKAYLLVEEEHIVVAR